MKNFSILALLALATVSCTNNPASTSTNGNLTMKASTFSATGKTSATAKTSVTSTVVITDFKINIGSIKLEAAMDDAMHQTADSVHEDTKLVGPFLLDLLDPNKPLSQVIATVNVPNGKYSEVKFKFVKSNVAGDMMGKTYLIKGTIDGKDFVISSDQEVELKTRFMDPTKDLLVNSNSTSLDIKIQLDAIMTKLRTLASQNLLVDGNGDGVIEISTTNVDGNQAAGDAIKSLLENETHLDDKE